MNAMCEGQLFRTALMLVRVLEVDRRRDCSSVSYLIGAMLVCWCALPVVACADGHLDTRRLGSTQHLAKA